jgi:hypothetical protein
LGSLLSTLKIKKEGVAPVQEPLHSFCLYQS